MSQLANSLVNYITFNQDYSCVALGLSSGYKIYNNHKSYNKVYDSVGIVEMLYTTSLIAIVPLGEEHGSSPRKLKIINTKRNESICDLLFPKSILKVKLTYSRLIVVLEDQIYIYEIGSMKLLHRIETSVNGRGLVTVSHSVSAPNMGTLSADTESDIDNTLVGESKVSEFDSSTNHSVSIENSSKKSISNLSTGLDIMKNLNSDDISLSSPKNNFNEVETSIEKSIPIDKSSFIDDPKSFLKSIEKSNSMEDSKSFLKSFARNLARSSYASLSGNSIKSTSATSSGSDLLAYPSPPKTITHDSLIAQGINTNGGSMSVHNNVQSVSNSPNRVGDVIIFNLQTLQPISVIEAHKATLAAICFSSDGSLLATASEKGTIVRVFEVVSGVKLYQFRRGTYPTKIYSLNFSKDKQYVISTSSSGTVHIFRLGEDEALENKHKKKRLDKKKNVDTIDEEPEDLQGTPTTSISNITATSKPINHEDFLDEIHDDGDDSDEEVIDHDDPEDYESIDILYNKQRKLSAGSSNSFTSIGTDEIINSTIKSEPLVDQNRLSVARLIRRSSQKIGRKAAQKLGEFLPQRFSSILEPTRHFASLKINSNNKDVKAIAILFNELKQDLVPQSYLSDFPENSQDSKELTSVNLLHIHVVTAEGFLYVYGLDPERGGDCILLNKKSLLEDAD